MQVSERRPRTDIITASRVDLIIALLPIITIMEAVQSMIDSGVPADVAARVLDNPEQRRPMPPPAAFPE